MKCHILFSGKNKKNISKYRLLKILPRVLSVKTGLCCSSNGLKYAPNGVKKKLKTVSVWADGQVQSIIPVLTALHLNTLPCLYRKNARHHENIPL